MAPPTRPAPMPAAGTAAPSPVLVAPDVDVPPDVSAEGRPFFERQQLRATARRRLLEEIERSIPECPPDGPGCREAWRSLARLVAALRDPFAWGGGGRVCPGALPEYERLARREHAYDAYVEERWSRIEQLLRTRLGDAVGAAARWRMLVKQEEQARPEPCVEPPPPCNER